MVLASKAAWIHADLFGIAHPGHEGDLPRMAIASQPKKFAEVRTGADQLTPCDDDVLAGVLALVQALEAFPVSIVFHDPKCKENSGGRQGGERQSRYRKGRRTTSPLAGAGFVLLRCGHQPQLRRDPPEASCPTEALAKGDGEGGNRRPPGWEPYEPASRQTALSGRSPQAMNDPDLLYTAEPRGAGAVPARVADFEVAVLERLRRASGVTDHSALLLRNRLRRRSSPPGMRK